MAVVLTLSNHYKYQLMDKQIDLSADSLIILLMNNTFAFNKDTHATYALVSGSELATANGYTQKTKALANLVLAEDDANDKGKMTCDDLFWTAGGGDIGPTGSAVIIDDTTADDTVIGCIDYGTDFTIPNGSEFHIKDIQIDTT